MSVLQALDIGLAALVLAVVVWTIAAREAFAAVVGYVAYGLLLSIVRVRLFCGRYGANGGRHRQRRDWAPPHACWKPRKPRPTNNPARRCVL
jgi:hypothetical protein